MSLLSRSDILEAAHDLYCVAVNDVWDERRRKRPREYAPFRAMVDPLPESEQLSIMWRIIGRVEQAWGFDVGLVFHHADIADAARALYYLVMGCMGHGVSLADDHGEQLDTAAGILNRYTGGSFDPSPIHIDDPWHELAWEHYGEETSDE